MIHLWSFIFLMAFHNMLIEELESCGLLMDYCNVFISCSDSHSDGTRNAKFLQICSDEEINSSIFVNFYFSHKS